MINAVGRPQAQRFVARCLNDERQNRGINPELPLGDWKKRDFSRDTERTRAHRRVGGRSDTGEHEREDKEGPEHAIRRHIRKNVSTFSV